MPELGVSAEDGRSGRRLAGHRHCVAGMAWPAADARALGGLASRLPELIEDGERNIIRLPIGSDQAAHE
jgi:hypothetical protein